MKGYAQSDVEYLQGVLWGFFGAVVREHVEVGEDGWMGARVESAYRVYRYPLLLSFNTLLATGSVAITLGLDSRDGLRLVG